jgi:hypothetical protein
MKLMICMILTLLSTISLAQDGSIEMRFLTPDHRLVVNKDMSSGYSKSLYIQGGKQVSKLDPKKPFCELHNARDKKEKMYVYRGQTFSFDDYDYLRERTYISIRIWHRYWLIVKDNAVANSITCSTRPIAGLDSPSLTLNELKKIVGNLLTIK